MNDQSTTGLGTGFNIPDPADLPSLKGKVSDVEWALRVELAATYRLCALHGWTDLVFTHISARLPEEDGEERFLINPYGIMFDEMTASCLVKIDLHGNICQETPYFINPAGFTIHSAIHAARETAGCVIHVHTPYGVAVSVQNEGLRRYTQFSMIVNNDLAYHDYEGIALDLDERDRIVNDLGDKNLYDGTISAVDTITVRKTAHLSGELSASRLRIEYGTNLQNAVFSGRISLTDR